MWEAQELENVGGKIGYKNSPVVIWIGSREVLLYVNNGS